MNLLVRRFLDPSGPPLEAAAFGDWLTIVQKEWNQRAVVAEASTADSIFSIYDDDRGDEGSYGTFLGFEIGDLDGDGRSSWWRALSIGDTVLFHVRGAKLVGQSPTLRADDFGRGPSLVHSSSEWLRSDCSAIVLEHGGPLLDGDVVLVATDAIAAWMLRRHESGAPVWDLAVRTRRGPVRRTGGRAAGQRGDGERRRHRARRPRHRQARRTTGRSCAAGRRRTMTEQGRWPSATDYIDAVQHPSVVFADGELKEARFDLDMYGIPDGCTGSNAIVFRAMLGRRTVALRCFTSQAGLSRERYLALARHVQADERGARWLVPAGWREDALRVKGDQWPLIEMEWVNGRPLDVYVGSLCQTQPSALRLLADRWLEMLLDLAVAQVAHGDLQHGNVLVDQSSTALRLVDLDGAWVPGMEGLTAPAESGHQAFRHPNRPSTDQWGAYMDTFPGLVVLVSLLALASRPDLWATYNNGDNLIFTADDFTSVDATSLWRDLAKIDDREVADLVLLLKQCCDPTWQPGTARSPS